MSGSSLGYIKGKMGLKGKTKPGDMISRMNKMKSDSLTKEVKLPQIKNTIKKII